MFAPRRCPRPRIAWRIAARPRGGRRAAGPEAVAGPGRRRPRVRPRPAPSAPRRTPDERERPADGRRARPRHRTAASAVADVRAFADALGIDRFAVMGRSGGGPHALACAAPLADRVLAVVSVAGSAPFDAEGGSALEWPSTYRGA
ncbi:alpha/beta fold hydrolase [Streptomyces sp. NPDC059382]|uniref:alpha/beta fold hydrolase n=1 Tax=Streptomyces sp. NPDC059382 TaxID=3346816 RepID=UPI0036B035DA